MDNLQDYKIEEIKALYFDKDALVEPPYKLYRVDGKGGYRHYYRYVESGEPGVPDTPKFYFSVTSFLSTTLPTAPQLIDWMISMGKENAREFVRQRAGYGTYLHIQVEKLSVNREYDFDAMEEDMKAYIEENEYPPSWFDLWYHEIKKDILAWGKFMIDHNVKVVAVEVVLCSDESGYAGAIDLVCDMDIEEKGFWGELYKSGVNKDKPKETKKTIRIRGMIDIKGGRKGFYESHEIQLHAYKQMWEENFPDYPIDRVFNWSAKEWRSEPGYHLKDQTGSKNALKLPELVKLGQVADSQKSNTVTIIQGKLDLEKGVEDNYKYVTLTELVTKNDEKK